MLKMHRLLATLFLTALFLGLPHASRAQSPQESSGQGLIWYESVIGSSSSLGTVTRFDSTLGYNFNHHFAADFGVPVLFVHASSTTTTATTTGFRSANGIGDVYTDMRFTFRNPAVNFISTVRGSLPTGSTSNGFSTGRVTADWNNHFDRAFGHVTPYAELGVANTVPQSAYFERPFTTLGLTGHFEGGTSIAIWRHLDFHASAYAIEPSGQQKVFSKFLTRQSGATATGPGASRNRVFQTAPETTGSADIARDHGFSLGFNASPFRLVDLAIGYTRSASFDLNTVYFGVGFNLARFLGSSSRNKGGT